MAIRTIKQTGDWTNPNTWDEGEVPTAEDDVVWQSGSLTINTSDAICNTMTLQEYDGYLNWDNGAVLTIVSNLYLDQSSGLILVLANPEERIVFQSSTVSVWYDGERQVAVFDNGSEIFYIPYV